VIEPVWRYTWRPRFSELRGADRGRDRASLEIHFKPVIEWTESCTWRTSSIKGEDALGRRGQVHFEMHSEALNKRVWRWPWRPRSCELWAALGGHDRSSLEMHLEAMISCNEMRWEAEIERVRRCSCSRLWSTRIEGVLRCGRSAGGRWEARQVLRLHPSLS